MFKEEDQKRVGSATRTTGKSPIEMIAQEHQAQVLLGYDAAHDDRYSSGELAAAAACFALGSTDLHLSGAADTRGLWPEEWSRDLLGAHTRMRQLVVAGALIAAEIERLQRAHFAAIDAAQKSPMDLLEF